MFVDTHTHLYLPDFAADTPAPQPAGTEAVGRAIEAGVSALVFPNVDLATIAPMRLLHDRFPQATFMAMGLHPTEIGPDFAEPLETIRHELFSRHTDYCAVGEIGIDLYWDATHRNLQMQALDTQLRWAVELGIPVIIHCRNALDETLEVLSGYPDLAGVMHSFGGTAADVHRILSTVPRFLFGINGTVTFKNNSSLRTTIPAIPADRLILETDSPYLAPVPKRGRRNESAYIPYIAACIADISGTDIADIASQTSANAARLFRIPL